jgi:hypothetical protein
VQRRGFNNRMAVLLGSNGETYMLPVLDKARLLAMNDRGVLLTGIECYPPRGAKGRGAMYPQTWWCVLRGGPAKTIGDPAEARRLEHERRRANLATHSTVGRRVGDHLIFDGRDDGII